MKKYISLLTTLLFFVSGIFLTGCSKSDQKTLADSLALTNTAESMEINLTSSTEINGKSMELKMNMQAEDIQKDMKGKIEMDMLGMKQEFYLVFSNGSLKMYSKGLSGKYTSQTIDSSELEGIDAKKSFAAYIDVIDKNPDMIKKISDKTYELNIPKEKVSEIYSKIAGKGSAQSFDELSIQFVIGNDGYIQKVKVKTTTGSTSAEATSEYFNFNKKFDIQIPDVSK